MTEKTIIKYIEIPIIVKGYVTPGEKPDYSERSPCPGSPIEAEVSRVSANWLTDKQVENLINDHCPGFWDKAEEGLIESAEKHKEYAKDHLID